MLYAKKSVSAEDSHAEARMKGKAHSRKHIVYTASTVLAAHEPAWITSNQIEACPCRDDTDISRGAVQVWIKIFPHKPVTEKPAETRMGSGKGSPEYWVAVVKARQGDV